MVPGTALKKLKPVSNSIVRADVMYCCQGVVTVLVFGMRMVMTRFEMVRRLNAVPAPVGTTTTVFHVFDGIAASPDGIREPLNPLGPQVIKSSLPD